MTATIYRHIDGRIWWSCRHKDNTAFCSIKSVGSVKTVALWQMSLDVSRCLPTIHCLRLIEDVHLTTCVKSIYETADGCYTQTVAARIYKRTHFLSLTLPFNSEKAQCQACSIELSPPAPGLSVIQSPQIVTLLLNRFLDSPRPP